MKYILAVLGVGAICLGIFCFGGNKAPENDYMRIHVVANSNSNFDTNIKYVVKDAVVEFLIPYLSEAQNKQQAMKIISEKVEQISLIANAALQKEGVSYSAEVVLDKEQVPTRVYGNLVLDEGIYDCLQINLGQANGDNWWCVVFPAVCFVDSQNPENIEYVSKIWEIINSAL